MSFFTTIIIWAVLLLFVWSLFCIVCKNRDTSSVNNAAQLESIFAPCLKTKTLSEESMVKQISGLEKLRSYRMQWITTCPPDISDHVIQQNHLRFSCLLRMSNPHSQIDIVHQSSHHSIALSTWALESNVNLHGEEQDIKSLTDASSFDITVLFDLEHSLFSLPTLLDALSDCKEWDLAVFHPAIVVPGLFGCSTMNPWWVRKCKTRDEWFSKVNMDEIQMSSKMVWINNKSDIFQSLPNVLTCRSILRSAHENNENEIRIVDYQQACLISAKTAYYSY